MGQFGYEHGWHAIQTGAAFLGNGRQYGFGLEGFIGKHHAGTMAGAAQIAHHHTEAVIQRYRNTHPVLVCIATAFGNKVTVVKDIAMGQRGAFGQSGSAGRILNIDGVVVIKRRRSCSYRIGVD